MQRMIMLVVVMLLLAGCTAPEQQVTRTPTPAESFLAAGELPDEYRIDGISVYPGADLPGDLALAPLGLDLAMSMPAAYGDGGQFTVTVNGQVIPHKLVGGGFGDGRIINVLRLYPGVPGAKQITVSYANRGEIYAASQNHEFVSTGDALLLEHYDGELLLQPAAFSMLAYFVAELQVTCNGATLTPDETGGVPPLAGAPAQLLTFRPELQPGRNELVMQWRDSAGAAQEKKYAFTYAPEGRLKVGAAVPLGFGYEGSRSGPFFQLAPDDTGAVVAIADDKSTAHFPRLADGQLTFGSTLRQEIRAVAPGRVTITIMKSRYFLFPYEPEGSVVLTVAP